MVYSARVPVELQGHLALGRPGTTRCSPPQQRATESTTDVRTIDDRARRPIPARAHCAHRTLAITSYQSARTVARVAASYNLRRHKGDAQRSTQGVLSRIYTIDYSVNSILERLDLGERYSRSLDPLFDYDGARQQQQDIAIGAC